MSEEVKEQTVTETQDGGLEVTVDEPIVEDTVVEPVEQPKEETQPVEKKEKHRMTKKRKAVVTIKTVK